MAKHDESEGEVLRTEEMKKTKGGAGFREPAEAPKRTIIEEVSLQDEAILPVSQPAAGAISPSAQEDAARGRLKR
jgi:hypothetical protein